MDIEPITKEQAIEAYGGNASALARDLKITPSAIYQWPDGPIAEGYALKLKFVLRPDVFGAGQVARRGTVAEDQGVATTAASTFPVSPAEPVRQARVG